jgi:hypothetical protein
MSNIKHILVIAVAVLLYGCATPTVTTNYLGGPSYYIEGGVLHAKVESGTYYLVSPQWDFGGGYGQQERWCREGESLNRYYHRTRATATNTQLEPVFVPNL